MDKRDYIGERGEILVTAAITKWCDGEPWFTEVVFLGAKAEAKDFMVSLIAPSAGEATFFVQVKATTTGYTGTGAARKLRVKVGREAVQRLKAVPGPAYVVGVDIVAEAAFLLPITAATTGPINGIPTTHKLTCGTLKRLWQEVDDYWVARTTLPKTSAFSR
ncbi:MAG: hypothetical protein K2P78_00545 [Gemmataceae bacterium]|nr:hypothetical protein [Gemmataceae bacterium]